jgi:preprotein translocase subunit YajC
MNGTILIVLAAVALGMWWFIARPQKQKQQALQQAVQAADPGTEIITLGGIYGTVIENDPEETSIIIEIAEGVEMRIARRAIANVVPPHESPSADPEDDPDSDDEVAEGEIVDDHDSAETADGPTRTTASG